MKKITLLCLLLVVSFAFSQETVFEDSFDSYTDFATDNVGSWTLIDEDGLPTYGFTGVTFEGSGDAKSFQVFNSLATTPPLEASDTSDWSGRTGDKAMVCFAAVPDLFGNVNNDWLISPEITLGTGGSTLSFWYKAASATFFQEQFTVGVSTTDTDPNSFELISADPVVVQDEDDVTYVEFTADLTSFEGSSIYIGINCISNDQFGFMVDDFVVTSQTLSVDQFDLANFEYFVDAQNILNLSANDEIKNLSLYNMLGQQVLRQDLSSQNEQIDLNGFSTGAYLVKVQINDATKTFKVLKK